METTINGVQKAQFQEINIASFNNNAAVLDEHISNKDIHVKVCNIAGIAESDELKQIDCTDTNRTLWGKIKKTISVLIGHLDKAASETTLGHIKIGTGLEMQDGVVKVKIANDFTTNDSESAMSAAMGGQIKDNFMSIKNELNKDTFIVPPLVTGKGLTLVAGGYLQIGKMTYINIQLKATSAINNIPVSYSLPIPKAGQIIPLSSFQLADGLAQRCFVHTNGDLYANIAENQRIVIAGSYVAV